MRICPECQAEPVHQAPFRVTDYILALFRWGNCPYGCDKCGHRFWKSWTWVG